MVLFLLLVLLPRFWQAGEEGALFPEVKGTEVNIPAPEVAPPKLPSLLEGEVPSFEVRGLEINGLNPQGLNPNLPDVSLGTGEGGEK